jgi:hypothetical protein
MAKKKAKKNLIKLVLNVLVIAFAVLTIMTMFMPVISVAGKVGILGFGKETTTAIKGIDVFAAALNGKVSSNLSTETNLLVGLKVSDNAVFVSNVFIWGYILTIVVSVAVLVFSILTLLGMKINKVNTILGVVFALLAVVTFIFAIIVAVNFSADAGIDGLLSAGSKGYIAFGTYALIGTLLAGSALVYGNRK